MPRFRDPTTDVIPILGPTTYVRPGPPPAPEPSQIAREVAAELVRLGAPQTGAPAPSPDPSPGRKAQSRTDALTTEDACRALGCGVKRLRALLTAKKLQRAPSFGTATMITRESVESLLAGTAPKPRRKVEAVEQPPDAPREYTAEELRAAGARARRRSPRTSD
jgi:hypothetical protein